MRQLLPLALVVVVACATTADPSPRPRGVTVERRNTGVTLVGRAEGDFAVSSMVQASVFEMSTSPHIVWEVLPAAYESLGIPLTHHDEATLTTGNLGMVVRTGRIGSRRASQYLDCGVDAMTGPVADRSDMRISITAQAKPSGEQSVLAVQVTATASQRGNSASTVTCASNGILERALVVAARLELAEE